MRVSYVNERIDNQMIITKDTERALNYKYMIMQLAPMNDCDI